MKKLLPLLAMTLLLPIHVFSEIRYVDPSGTEVPPYDTWETAAQTIESALALCSDGDTVMVGSGTYSVTHELTIDSGIELVSANGSESTIIQGDGFTRCVYATHSNAVVRGFTITSGGGECELIYLMYLGTAVYCRNGASLLDCIVEKNTNVGIGAGAVCVSEGSRMERCIVRDNISLYGGGVYATNAIVYQCLILRNTASSGGGIALDGGDAYVGNCTIVSNSAEYYGGGIATAQSKNTIENCIVIDNSASTGPNYYNWTTEDTYSHTLSEPFGGTFTNENGNIDLDPIFVDPGADDYRLCANSPAVDAGTSVSMPSYVSNAFETVLLDLAGKSRKFSREVDMGAYEFSIGGKVVSAEAGLRTTWEVAPNAICQLQYSSLASPDWINIGNVVTTETTAITINDPEADPACRIYRLIWLR